MKRLKDMAQLSEIVKNRFRLFADFGPLRPFIPNANTNLGVVRGFLTVREPTWSAPLIILFLRVIPSDTAIAR